MYSQSEEEKYIIAAAERSEAKGLTRRLLDIGAWHATDKSNSRALLERGWSGILIDPAPGPFVNLMRACSVCKDTEPEAHGDRKELPCRVCGAVRYGFWDRVILILAAVGINRGLMTLQATDDALTTSDPASFELWNSGRIRGGYHGGFYGQYLTPTLTLDDFFYQYGGDFQFVSIDTEGTSVDLLREMLRIGPHPECICVEHNDRHHDIDQLAAEYNYNRVYGNQTNVVLEVKR